MHLEHLQSILQEFDPKSAPQKSDLIRSFQDGLQSSIQAEMESQEEEFRNWDVLIRKATAVESKTQRRPASQIKELDQYCPRGHRPSLQANKSHQQAIRQGQDPMKDPYQHEPKPSGPALQQRNEANRSEEKKFRRDKKICRRQEQKEQNNPRENLAAGSTPATGANSSGGFKKKDNSGIVCYNCNKKGHISRNCSEPRRDNASKN